MRSASRRTGSGIRKLCSADTRVSSFENVDVSGEKFRILAITPQFVPCLSDSIGLWAANHFINSERMRSPESVLSFPADLVQALIASASGVFEPK